MAHEEESEPQAIERLALINDELFVRRSSPLGREGVGLAASLVVQMAATKCVLGLYLFLLVVVSLTSLR